MVKMKLIFTIIFIGIFAVSCTEEGNDGFKKLEDTVETSGNSEAADEAVEIISVSPLTDPVILITSSSQTFAVQVNSGAGDVNYTFKLDGSLLQDSTSPFYNLSAVGVAAGLHSLEVVATNSVGSDSHTFNVRKNTPPTVNLDSNTSQTISCVADSFQLDITASDTDGDSLTYGFYLNGAVGSAFLATSTGLSSASTVFTPNCSLAGNNNVTIRVTDSQGEFSEYTMAVTVTNPNVTSIDSYSPTSNPVVILSTETKSFIVSASGNPPLSYAWDINPGSTIAACNDLTNCNVGGGDFTPGNYVLTATVTDSLATSDSHDFNVTINQKPQISFQTPSNASVIKMNCASSKNFQLTVSDANWADGQSHTVTWLFDGGSNAALTNTTNLGVHPMTTDATFSPNCQAALIGDHTIKAIISDGFETQEIEWDISVNYFSDTCNNLAAGEVCTVAGLVGMGSGLTDSDSELRIRADYIEKHPSGGYFFSDSLRHSVWFYNDTAGALTILGKSIAANTVVSLFGQTNLGLGTDGQSYNNYYLYEPKDLAYSATEDALYVADYRNHQVVRFNSSGQGYRWAGKSSSNTDGVARKSHKCNYPVGLDIDETEGKVFVACYGNTNGADGSVKYFLTGADQGYTLVRYTNNVTEGTTSYAGSARIGRSYSLTLDPNDRIVYVGDFTKYRISAISYGDAATFHNGAVVLGANNLMMLSKGNGAGESFTKIWSNNGAKLRPYDLETYSVAGVTKGIFYTNTTRHYIGLLNTSAADITLGGRTTSAGYNNYVYGKYNTADYSRGEPASTNTLLYSPLGIMISGNTLYVADRTNGKIATFDVSIANGLSDDLVGNLKVTDYDDENPKQANKRYLSYPRAMEFSATENAMIFNDHGNMRIRKMDLTTGSITTLIGRGAAGNADSQTEDPNDIYFRNVGDLFASNDSSYLFYTDYRGGNGTNRNCQARIFNRTASTQTLFNQAIPAAKVNDVAGNYTLGCNTWNSATYNNTQATLARLQYPVGIAANSDQSKMYIGDRSIHCIMGVDASGVLSETVGQCKLNGDIMGALASAKFQNPGDFSVDSDAVHGPSGNFFMVDKWITTNSYIKYVNVSASDVTIFGGVTIPAGEVGKIISTEGYSGGVASFGDQICYTQGANANGHQYPHNVICVNRNSGLTTLRVGKISASTVKAATPHYNEEEGVNASSSSLSAPWGIAFDADGNLYVTSHTAHNIRMVKRWF